MDCSLASWGAAMLRELCDSMISESPLWTDMQISEVEKDYTNARQYSIQFFPEWLKYQSPRSDNPSDVGDFKHKMIRVIGSTLKKNGLDNEFDQLEKHTIHVIKNAEAIAEARQLLRDVQSWLVAHADAMKVGRIAEIRALRQVGLEYSRKLQGLSQRAHLSEVVQLRTQLSEFIQKLKAAEDELFNRASTLWDTQIRNDADIDKVTSEVDSLVYAFDNLPNDLQDLQLMQRVLRIYRAYYQRLSDDNLPWNSFERIADEMRKECGAVLGEEEVPWPPDKIVDAFVEDISVKREERGLAWITWIKNEASCVASMTAVEANRIHAQLSNPPVVLTETHTQMLTEVIRRVNQRLSELIMEWLIEKFKELSPQNRMEFLLIAQRILSEK